MGNFEKCKWAKQCGHELCIPELCAEFAEKRMTNSDRLRAMSDEELAEFLSYGCPCPTENCRPSCVNCIGNWLKQPAEVE